MTEALLEMADITKAFPGVLANDRVSFDLREGEVHALVGENGAGKSTLMNILYGLYRPDSGRIAVSGEDIAIRNPKDAIRYGIGMVHQHFMLVPPFTVMENIVLGEETHTAGVIRMGYPAQKIQRLMQENGLRVELEARVEDLPVGLQQRVEILKILYRGARILVFDEPTAVLTPQEADELFDTFRELKAQGRGIIFISHKLDEVLAIADRITVIRRGKIIETLPGGQATKAQIAELMVGKPVLLSVDNPEPRCGSPVLQVAGLTMNNSQGTRALNGVDFSVCEGEIYGIAGVEGNGQSELVRAIAEKTALESGNILLDGTSILEFDVRQRREIGISHIPADRHRYGLLLPFPLDVNLVLGRHHLPPFVNRFRVADADAIRSFARQTIRQFDIRTPSEATPANTLSGGNQQKVIIARELSANPRLLLASQPTRGVDIGATEFIYRQLIKAKTEGRAVLLVSADLDEILSLSDRIGVMYKGRIIREFASIEAKKEEVGFYMMERNSMASGVSRFRISKYQLLETFSPLAGFLMSLAILVIMILLVGESPGNAFKAIYRFTMGTSARLATVFSVAIPLYLAGIAVAFAFRAGVFNIGVEGQYFFGGMIGAMAGIYVPLPGVLHIPFVILCAMAGGALWALIPAILKVTRGVHEVITTIMFNNIALALVNYLVNGPLSGMTDTTSLEPQTRHILETALFGKLNFLFRAIGWNVPDHVYLDYSLIIAIVMGMLVWFVLFKLRYGFEVRSVGTAIEVSHYAGMRVKRIQVGAFLASGALAGLIGLQEIFAIRGFYTYGIASGLGFDGIAIALIGRNSPFGVIFAAILFAFLKQAGYGLQLFTTVPNSIIYVITGLMILIIVATNEVVTAYTRSLRKKEAA